MADQVEQLSVGFSDDVSAGAKAAADALAKLGDQAVATEDKVARSSRSGAALAKQYGDSERLAAKLAATTKQYTGALTDLDKSELGASDRERLRTNILAQQAAAVQKTTESHQRYIAAMVGAIAPANDLAKATNEHSAALGRVGAAAKLSYTDMEILRAGAINTAQSLAAGLGAAKTFETQILQTLPALGGVVRALGTDMVVAGGAAVAVIGTLVGGFALGISRALEMESQVRRLSTTMAGMGNVAGVSGAQARSIAQSLFQQGGTQADAVSTVQTVLRTPSVQGPMVGRIARNVLDLSAASGMSPAEAAQAQIDMVDKGLPAIKKLADAMRLLTTSERAALQTMAEHGDQTGMLDLAFGRLEDRIKGAHERGLSPAAKAFHDMEVGWSGFVDKVAQSGPVLTAIEFLKRDLEIMDRVMSGQNVNGPAIIEAISRPELTVGQGGGRTMLDQIQRRVRPEAAPNFEGMPTPANLTPAPSVNVADERSNNLVKEATSANDKLAVAMNKVGLARELAIARIQAETDNDVRHITGAAADNNIREKQREVLLRQAGAIAEVTAASQLQAQATQGVVDAYTRSAAAGAHAESVLQATLTVQQRGGSVIEETMRLDKARADAALVNAAKALPALQLQVDAQARLTAAEGQGGLALAEVARQNEVAANKAALVAAGNDAESDAVKRLVAQYDALTQKRLADQQAAEAARAIRLAGYDVEISKMQAAGATLFSPDARRASDMAIERQQVINQLTEQYGSIANTTAQQLLSMYDTAAANRDVARFYGDVRNQAAQLSGDIKGFLLDGLTGANNGGKSIFANLWDTALQGAKRFALNVALTFAEQKFIMPIAMQVVGGASSMFGIASPQGGGGSGYGSVLSLLGGGSGSQLANWGGSNFVGPLNQGGGQQVVNSNGDVIGTLQQGGSLLRMGDTLSGGSLFGSNGSVGGIFSGDGFLSKSSINQFGSDYFGLSSGMQSPDLLAASGSSMAEQGIGAGEMAGGAMDAGMLGTTTLTEAIPYVGAAISAITAMAQGNFAQAGLIAAGAAIGSIIPGVGTAIGAMVGAIAGSFIKMGQSSPLSSTSLGVSGGRLTVGDSSTFKMGSGATEGMAGAFAGGVNSFLDSYNLSVSDKSASGFHPFGVASKYGTYYGIDPRDTKGYKNPDDALAASSAYLIQQRTRDGGAGIFANAPGSVGIAENAVLAATGAQSFKDLANELNLAIAAAQRYDAELVATGHSTGQITQSMQQLRKSIDDAINQANGYGLDITPLAKAFGNQFDTLIGEQIQAITDPTQAALDALSRDQQSRLDMAKYLGADLNQVEKLNGLERVKITQQANATIISSYQQLATQTASSMAQLIASLTLGSGSPLSPTDQFTAATALYNQTRAAALGGDAGAIGQFSSVASGYLNLARRTYATTAPYVDAYKDVLGTAAQIATKTANYSGAVSALGASTMLTPGNLPAFAGGGSFMVGGAGGIDSQVVAFRASPSERVTISNGANDNIAAAVIGSSKQLYMAHLQGTAMIAGLLQTVVDRLDDHTSELSKLRAENTALLRQIKELAA